MKKSLSLILALAMVFTMFASVVSADDTTAATPTTVTAATYTPQQAFDFLKEAGIVEGDAVKGADLDGNLTRAQFAKVIAKLWELPEAPEASTVYSDLSGAGWAAGYIGAATKKGLLNGVGGGKFNPSGNVKLEEIAKVVATGFGLKDVAYAGTGKVDSWAKGYVGAVIGAKLVADSADFTKAAKRGEIFTIGYTGYLALEALKVPPTPTPTPVATAVVTGVTAIDATTIKVTFDKAVKAEAKDFAVADSAKAAVAVSSAASADAGTVVILKVAALTVGSKYSVTFGGVTNDVVATTLDDTTTPALASAVAITGNVVRATFETRNINKDSLVAANFALDNGATVTGAKLDTATMSNDGQENNTVILLDVTGLSAGKAFTLTSKSITSYEGAVATTSTAAFAGKDVDVTAPVVAGAASVAGYKVNVIFTEDGILDASALVLTNYTITPALAITKAEFKKNVLGNNIVTLTTADQKSGIAYTVSVNGVSDGKNVMTTAGTAAFAGLDKVLNQTVLGAVATNSTKVVVTFGYEANATALVAANYTLDNGVTVSSAAFKADASEADGLDQTKVVLTTTALKSAVAYNLTVSTAVQDVLNQGLSAAATVAFAGKDAITSFGSVAAVSTDKNTVTVTFSQEVDRASAITLANYNINELGYPSSVSLNAAGTVATLKTATQTAGKAYSLTVNNLKDTFGNVVTANTIATFTGKGDVVDRLKVTGASAVSTTKIRVNFNQKLTASTLDQVTLTASTGSYTVASAVAVAGNDYVILTLSSGTINASTVYTVTVGTTSLLRAQYTLHDVSTAVEADRKATFVGTDSTLPTFGTTGIIVLDKTHVQVNFDSALVITAANTTAGALTLYTNTGLTDNPIASNAGTVLLNDNKSAIFTFSTNLADSTVYYAKLLRQHKTTGPVEDFKTADGLVLATDAADKPYKTLTAVTGTLVASSATTLDITAAKMIDVNTLEVKFNVDTTKATVTPSNILIAKTSDGGSVVTVSRLVWTDSRTALIYFTGAAALDNTNGIHYVRFIGNEIAAFVGGSTTFATDKSYESFAKNAVDNAKPTIGSVEPVTVNILKVTASEKVFKGNIGTNNYSDPITAANLVIYNRDEAQLVSNYSITTEDNKVFYVTLNAGVFVAAANYQIGFTGDVYGADGYVKADVYTTSSTTNSINFGGIAAALTAPTATVTGANIVLNVSPTTNTILVSVGGTKATKADLLNDWNDYSNGDIITATNGQHVTLLSVDTANNTSVVVDYVVTVSGGVTTVTKQ